jgi:hypothetical protein
MHAYAISFPDIRVFELISRSLSPRQTYSQAVTPGVRHYPFYPLFRDVRSTHQPVGTQLILYVIRQSGVTGHFIVTGVNVRCWSTFLP